MRPGASHHRIARFPFRSVSSHGTLERIGGSTMTWSSCSPRPMFPSRLFSSAFSVALILSAALPSTGRAQGDQTGSIGGRVVDEQGAPLVGAQVAIPGTTVGTQSRSNGEYVLERV